MKQSKILLYDIETTPLLAWAWNRYPQNGVLKVERDWELLCIAYKWLGKSEVVVKGRDSRSEKQLAAEIAAQMSKADIIVTHNGVKFDNRKVEAKLAQFDLNPTPPQLQVDTCREARKFFGFSSNKLSELGKRLGLGDKVQTGGANLWFDCMAGNETAWRKMKRYNKQDVNLLEKLYVKLRPYLHNHPNMALLNDKPNSCTKCGSSHLKSHGWSYTRTKAYRRFKCQTCGGISTSTKAEVGRQVGVK